MLFEKREQVEAMLRCPRFEEDKKESEVLDAGKPVLADFNAGGCGPRQALKPILEELSEVNEAYKFVSINIDEQDELA